MPRKKAEQDAPESKGRPVAKGQDAILSVIVYTAQGEETRNYRLPGFVGNTLTWQRSGKALDDILIPALQRVFGGQVTAE